MTYRKAAGLAKSARDEKFSESLEAWPIALPPDQEVGPGCYGLHVFQEAGRPPVSSQSGCIIIAPHWSKDFSHFLRL